jgi:hypothetical protein
MKQYILSRPVNALKKIYAPAYLGAKVRASKSSPNLKSIVELSIKKRLHSSEKWNYKPFKVFKGLDDRDHPEYRDYLAPSPSTATAEAYILNELFEALRAHSGSNVYSYIRAAKGSNHNYEYYLWNYERRNNDILAALGEEQDSIALFFDIKNFYGAVNQDLLQRKLKSHSVIGAVKNLYALDFLLDQLQQSPQGIPIGTELSHLAADVFLADLDDALAKKFGSKYFRYVDDITIVCARSQVAATESFLRNLIAGLGLVPNEKKREVFSQAQWRAEMDTSPVEGESFYEFCDILGNWMGDSVDRQNWLRAELQHQGFQIPLEKIVARKKSHIKKNDLDEREIIRKSRSIRSKYLSAVDAITEARPNEPSRWFLQKTKRAINPLFYLLNKEEYGIIREATSDSKSLTTQQEVSSAIHSGSCASLIKFPGVTVNTFCEIWNTIEPSGKKLTNKFDSDPSEAQLESIVILAMHNIIEAPPSVLNSKIWRALSPNAKSRDAQLTGFEEEIQSLRIGLEPEMQRDLLRARIDSSEDIVLDGLELGSQSISP